MHRLADLRDLSWQHLFGPHSRKWDTATPCPVIAEGDRAALITILNCGIIGSHRTRKAAGVNSAEALLAPAATL